LILFKKMNKRGNAVEDTLTALVIIVVFAIVSIFGFKMMSEFNDAWQSDPDMTEISKTVTQDFTTNYPILYDNAFILLVFMLWIGLMVMSFFIDSHPIFFVLTLLLLIFVFAAAAVMSNYFLDLAETGDMAGTMDSFPKMNWVMSNLLIVIIVIGISTSIALYSKTRAG